MTKNTTGLVIGISIALMLTGILLPITINDLVTYNGSYTNSSGAIIGYNSTVATLVSTVIPVIAIIALMMVFLANRKRLY